MLFEPSQSERIISGLKTNFNVSPSYSISQLFNLQISFFFFFFFQTITLCQIFHKRNQHSTSIFHRTHHSLSDSQYYIHNYEMLTKKNKNTCFRAYLYSAGTEHRKLHQLSVMMSRVIYFILWTHGETGVSKNQHRKNSGGV